MVGQSKVSGMHSPQTYEASPEAHLDHRTWALASKKINFLIPGSKEKSSRFSEVSGVVNEG